MTESDRPQLVRAASVTSLGTLASRVLGMLRDMATASLLGLSGDGVMDAFVIAFRVPNLFRRLFGEGALAASYLPVLSAALEEDRQRAWQLASVVFVWLAALLAVMVVVSEAVCAGLWYMLGEVEGVPRLLGLSAAMLPYLWFICLAAQVSATLQALAHFRTPAWTPAVLNVCWLIAAWGVAPCFAEDKLAQAYVLAGAVLVAGFVQLIVQWPVLNALGFRFDYDSAAVRDDVRRIVRGMLPMLLGLAVTQINTFVDSLVAWILAAGTRGPETFALFGRQIMYPLQQGAAAAVYYGERLYQFPLAIVGLAMATAIFPLLSRHAARGDHLRLAADLVVGLRLVLFLGIPASAGLMLLADPLVVLLFERGEFAAAVEPGQLSATARTARMIAGYGTGVWAYCALPVLVRGFYAVGDRTTPVATGVVAVAVNLTLNLTLVWSLAEAGLAISTAVAAGVQVGLLAVLFSRRVENLPWASLLNSVLKTAASTVVMTAAGLATLSAIDPGPQLAIKLARVGLPLIVCGGLFLALARLLRTQEASLLAAAFMRER